MPRPRALLAPVLAAAALAACSTPARSVPAGADATLTSGGTAAAAAPARPGGRSTPGNAAPQGPASRGTGRPTATAPRVPLPPRVVVVIDPGHNGGNASHPEIVNRLVPAGFGQVKACNTTGTASRHGYAEHAFNWDVALRVRAILAAHGLTVLFTRTNDVGVGPCVNQRAAFGIAHQAAMEVSIHADGHVGGHGFHVIEAARLPAGTTVGAASHRLAVAVHDHFAAASGFTPATYIGSGGYARRIDLAGLNLALRPAIMIECGNMLDPNDAARMESPAGRQRAAQAIAAGILGYLGR